MINTIVKAAGKAIFQALKKLLKKVSDQPKLIKVMNIVIMPDNNVAIIAVLTKRNLKPMFNLLLLSTVVG